jgi:hypothetical protein
MRQPIWLCFVCAYLWSFSLEVGAAQGQQQTAIQVKGEIARLRNEGSFLHNEVIRLQREMEPYRWEPHIDNVYKVVEDRRQQMEKFLQDLEPIFTAAEENQESLDSLTIELGKQRQRLDNILLKQRSAIAEWSLTNAPPSPRVTPIEIESSKAERGKVGAMRLTEYEFAFGSFWARTPRYLRPGQEGRTVVTFNPTTAFGQIPAGSLRVIPHGVSTLSSLIFEPEEFSKGSEKPLPFEADQPFVSDMTSPMKWTWKTVARDNFSGANFQIPFELSWRPNDAHSTSTWSQVGIEIDAPPSQPLWEALKGDVRVGVVTTFVSFPILRFLEWLLTLSWRRRRDRRESGLARAAAR